MILDLPHLERYWSRQMHRFPASDGDEWLRDKLLIHGLGVGLEQMAVYLRTPRSLDELERWILALNGGSIDEHRLARLRAALTGSPYDAATRAWLDSIDSAPPVLDEQQLRWWDERGYVVLHDAISPAECETAAALVYETVGADPRDPQTWDRRANMQGIMVQIFQDPRLEPARRSPRIHKAFAQLWGTPDLFVTTDRCGFNPPETPSFPFPGPWLHWDATLKPPVPFGIQGILYLTDTDEEQGAFTCVPGFHRELDAWLATLPPGADPQNHIPVHRARAIAGKAGDLVMWRDALPHGSRPNRGSRPRVVQYLKMFPPRRAALREP